MSGDVAFAFQRAPPAPAAEFDSEFERTIPSSLVAQDGSASLSQRWVSSSSSFPSASLSRPLSAASQRRPSLSQSPSQMVTSAISDEEDSEADEDDDSQGEERYSDDEEQYAAEEEQKEEDEAASPHRLQRLRSASHPEQYRDRHLSVEQPVSRARTPSVSVAGVTDSLSLASLTTGAALEVESLTGSQWRQRLRAMKQQITDSQYSRGERLMLAADSPFLHGAHGFSPADSISLSVSVTEVGMPRQSPPGLSQQGRIRSEATVRSTSRATAHHQSITSSNIPLLSSFDSAPSSSPLRFASTFDSASLSATARSTASSISTSLAVKHSAFAKDREGMEQERRELIKEKRRMVQTIDDHQRQLEAVQVQYEAAEGKLTAMANAKGMRKVGEGTNSRFERRAQTDDGQLNPHLSSSQLLASLQREIKELEQEKEDKEQRQDMEEERELEEDNKRRRQHEERAGVDDEAAGGDEDDPEREAFQGMSRRRRLQALRERKRQLMAELHAMQDQLMASRAKQDNSSTALELASLEADLITARAHLNEYEQQRERALDRLERSASPSSHARALPRSPPSWSVLRLTDLCSLSLLRVLFS